MAISHWIPAPGQEPPCGIVAASDGCWFWRFVAWPMLRLRGHNYGRWPARSGTVVRFLHRAMLFEVSEEARMAVGSLMLATIRTALPQWTQVLTSMANTRLRRCALLIERRRSSGRRRSSFALTSAGAHQWQPLCRATWRHLRMAAFSFLAKNLNHACGSDCAPACERLSTTARRKPGTPTT